MTTENEFVRRTFSIELSQSELKRILRYDPETGIFKWRVPRKGYRIGDIAGIMSEGSEYYKISINYKNFYCHKLAWFYVYGYWTLVDHINGAKGDNRLCNLRAATKQQNCMNQGVRITNMLGVKGVQQKGSRYRAYITHNYVTHHLGMFDTIEEASRARQKAEIEYFGAFANTGETSA